MVNEYVREYRCFKDKKSVKFKGDLSIERAVVCSTYNYMVLEEISSLLMSSILYTRCSIFLKNATTIYGIDFSINMRTFNSPVVYKMNGNSE